MYDHIQFFLWDVITHKCPEINGGLIKPPSRLGHGWCNYIPLFEVNAITYSCHNPQFGVPKVITWVSKRVTRKTRCRRKCNRRQHKNDVIMGSIASQIISLTIVYSIVYSDADQRKHQSSASLAFVRGIHQGPVNSPHKWPVTRKMFPFDDVIMTNAVDSGEIKKNAPDIVAPNVYKGLTM